MQVNPFSTNQPPTRASAAAGKQGYDLAELGAGDVLLVRNHGFAPGEQLMPRSLQPSGREELTRLEPPFPFSVSSLLVGGFTPKDIQPVPITYLFGKDGQKPRIIVGDPPLKQ